MKRNLCVVMSMMIVTAFLVSACAPAAEPPPAPAAAPAAEAEAGQEAEPETGNGDAGNGNAGDGGVVATHTSVGRGDGSNVVVYFSGSLNFTETRMYRLMYEYFHLNPDANVTFEFQGAEHDEARRRIQLMAHTDELPHLFWESFSEVPVMAELGVMADLTERIQGDSEWYNFFNPGALDNFTFNGRIRGTPDAADAMGFFYNQAIFNDLGLDIPVTWEDFLNAVVVIRDAGIVPIAHGGTDMWSIWGYNLFFHRYGYMENHEAFLNQEFTFADSRMIDAFRRIQELADLGAFPENVTTLSHTHAMEMWRGGNAAIVTTGTWSLPGFRNVEETPISDYIVFNWGPHFSDSTYEQRVALKEYTAGTFVGRRLEEYPEAFEEAMRFLRWRHSPEGSAALIEQGGLPASRFYGGDLYIPRLTQMMLEFLEDEYLPRLQLAVLHDTTFQEPFWNAVTAVISGVITPEEAARQVDNWNAGR